MTAITSIRGRQILDSRGNPTIEAEVALENGSIGRAAVPSGASTGAHEAVELRDGDKSRWGGKSVGKAVQSVNGPIAEALVGHDVEDQGEIDASMIALDASDNKGRLGANAILGVSLACAKAAAKAAGEPLYRYLGGSTGNMLPVPMMNILNGGAHANNPIDFQEFMIMPVGASSFSEALRCGAEIFHALKSDLAKAGLSTSVGDEGGFAPDIGSAREALDLIIRAVESTGYRAGDDVLLALDCAATEFYRDGAYHLEGEGRTLSSPGTGRISGRACARLSDRLDRGRHGEDDWAGWKQVTERLGGRNPAGRRRSVRHQHRSGFSGASSTGIANSILVKVNQIGTLTETIEAVDLSRDAAHPPLRGAAGQLYGMGLIGGFCHLYIGQEAVVVGMQMAMRRATASSPAIATTATCWPAAWTRRASWPS
jgi:enolase